MGRNNYGCYFFNEELVLEVLFVVCVGPAAALMYMLSRVDDAFGIRPEIFSVLVTMYLAAGISTAIGTAHRATYTSGYVVPCMRTNT